MKALKHLFFVLGAAGTLLSAGSALASSHREAPGISRDPVADNTDLWAWVTGEGTAGAVLHVVASYNPMEEPSGGPNFHSFGDDVRYEIHVARGDASLDDVISWHVDFDSSPLAKVDPSDLTAPLGGGKEFFAQLSGVEQSYTVTQKKVGEAKGTPIGGGKVVPANIGPRTNEVAYGLKTKGFATYEAFSQSFLATLTGGVKAWAGPRDDGFYVDLGGVFDLANLRGKGTAQDGVAGFNAHTIAFDIPVSSLPEAIGNADPKNKDLIGVWAAASRRKVRILRADGTEDSTGPWVQVSRLGLPLVNEALIGLQDKDKFNRTHPKDDVANFGAYFLNPVVVRDAEAVGIYTALKVDAATVAKLKTDRADILKIINLDDTPSAGSHTIPIAPGKTGDVLRVELNAPAGFPNGRPLKGGTNQENDVTDVLLTVILSGGAIPIADGVDRNDANYLSSIPYLATPWQGYDQGHGKPTP
jgi:hypothetical protein